MKRHLHYVGALIAVLMLLSSGSLLSQGWNKEDLKPNKNFYEIQKSFNSYWIDKNIHEKGKGWKNFKRWEWFWGQRVYPDGKFPNPDQTYLEYQKRLRMEKGNRDRTLTTGAWQILGPASNGGGYGGLGRINVVREHPTNSDILFAGAASGGLWKSTDGGANWSTNTDALGSLGVTDIVFDPNNSNTMFLATGDGEHSDTYSIGVLKSTNGGSTWNTTGLNWSQNNNRTISRLLINPSNSSILYAGGSNGIYKTTDGGSSWTLVFYAMSVKDMEFKPGTPSTIYAARNAIYRSTDNGSTWTQLTNGLPASGIERIAIAVSPDSANIVYALMSDASSSGFLALYRSTDSGDSWTQMSDSPNILGWNSDGSDTGGQGWYDLCLAVSPLDANEIYAGGVNVWKSTNGGANWSRATYWSNSYSPTIHADQHDLWFVPNSSRLYVGNDGGIYYTTNGGTSWSWLGSGLAITQFYRLGTSATDENIVIAGSQDNGTKLKNGTSWSDVLGGDGMECIVNYSNADIMYGELYYGRIKKSTDGGSTFNTINLPSEYNDGYGGWLTPYVMHPTDANTLYAGYRNVFKTTDGGSSWTQISNFTSGTITVLQVAPSNANYIYASTGASNLQVTTDGGTSWNEYALPAYTMMTYLAVDNDDPENIWITFSGYYSGQKVYNSTDAGQTWTNISGSLPNLPVNCIVYQKDYYDRIFIGNDIGVYYRDNNTNDWVAFGTGLPNVVVNELEIQYNAEKIRAATYGRGLWEAEIPTTMIAAPALLSPAANASDVEINTALSWNTATAASAYIAQYSTDAEFTSNTETTTSDTSWNISNLEYNTTYYWRVKSTDNGIESEWADARSFTTEQLVLSAPVLDSPEDNTINAGLSQTLSWNAVTNASGYVLQYSTVSDFSTNTEITGSDTDEDISGLDYSTTYYWRVKATYGTIESDWSSVWSFTTYTPSLDTPVLASPADNATNVSNSPDLSWNEVSGATTYYVQYSTNSDFSAYTEESVSTTSIGLSGLDYYTTYYWRVKAYDGSIYSNWSDARSFTTESLTLSSPALSSPSSGSTGLSVNLTLSWGSVANATGYTLQYSTVSDFSTNTELTTNTTSYSLSGLSYNTTYYWRVKATNGGVSSDWSSAWNFATETLTLAKPSLIYPRNRRRNIPANVTVEYSEVENATGYVVQYSTSSRFSNATEVSSSTTTCTLSLNYSTWYYWRVKATNGNVTSGYCTSRKFKTKSAKYGIPGDGILAGYEEFVISPNPAANNSELIFYVDENCRVELSLYDLSGREVLKVFDGYLSEGEYIKNINVSELDNGMYVAVLKMGDVVLPRKIVVLK